MVYARIYPSIHERNSYWGLKVLITLKVDSKRRYGASIGCAGRVPHRVNTGEARAVALPSRARKQAVSRFFNKPSEEAAEEAVALALVGKAIRLSSRPLADLVSGLLEKRFRLATA
jgi:hypothetical protein